jgi:uncharacterized protein (DUF1330 family)
MPAYLIVYRETPIRDDAAIETYSTMNRSNALYFQSEFQAKPLVIYGQSHAPEGDNPSGITMLEFPSMVMAKAFYESPAYQAAIPFRQQAADWRVVIVEGLPPRPQP